MRWISRIAEKFSKSKKCIVEDVVLDDSEDDSEDDSGSPNDPNNPFWVIYLITLEVLDVYAQTFKTEKAARRYVKELCHGKTLKTMLRGQVHLCTKEQSDEVIDDINMLDGRKQFIDHLETSECRI